MSEDGTLEKIRALIALALDDRTPRSEAINAAFVALRRIRDEKIVLGKLDAGGVLHTMGKSGGETTRGGIAHDELRVQAHLLIIQETPHLFRFCAMTKDTKSRGSSHYGAWPRTVIRSYTLLAEDVKKELYGASGRVTDTIVLERSFVERLEKQGMVRRI